MPHLTDGEVFPLQNRRSVLRFRPMPFLAERKCFLLYLDACFIDFSPLFSLFLGNMGGNLTVKVFPPVSAVNQDQLDISESGKQLSVHFFASV